MIPPVETSTRAPVPTRRAGWSRRIALVFLAVVLVLLGVAGVARYAVLLPAVRDLIEARSDGLRVGPLGKLRIEGLSGDLWRDARANRLTLRDSKGVWLEATNVKVTWDYKRLLRRQFAAEEIKVDTLKLLRRPVLTARQPSRGLPVSVRIGNAHTRLLLEPAFSSQRGLYDVGLTLDLARNGAKTGKFRADSALHIGDNAAADFSMSKVGRFQLNANAEEVKGGALAGSLGLPADLPFQLYVRADGTLSEGKFNVRATSGASFPLVSEGAWTPKGGQASGRLDLTASILTASLAARFGPEAKFQVSGIKSTGEDYALKGRLFTEAVTVQVQGLGNPGKLKLAPGGLRVEAQAPSLSRILTGPALGGARITGVITGEAVAWQFAGAGSVSDIEVGGYAMARLSGPIDFQRTKAGYGLKIILTGAGGKGDGYAAALLGGKPILALSAERQTNGQILIRHLDAVGPGINLQATGDRAILGGLKFAGKARISNLSAARDGASGSILLVGSAQKTGVDSPWTVSFDGRGDQLALGVAELDRLLGPMPTLKAEASWQAGRLSVARSSLKGAAAEAELVGVMEASGALAFKSNWSATGPFRAGPVEITGRAKGTGSVGGTLPAPRLDLLADIEQIDLPRLSLNAGRLALAFQAKPDGSNGSVSLVATSDYGPATARSDFRFSQGGVDLMDLNMDAGGAKARGSLSLRSRAPSAADLTVDVGPGAFLDAGQVTGTAKVMSQTGGLRAVLNLGAENLRARGSSISIRAAQLTADGPLDRLPYTLTARGASGQGAWTIKGRGHLEDLPVGYAMTLDGQGTLGDRDLHTVETALVRFGGLDQSARVRLAGSDGGKLELDGSLNGDVADVRARVVAMGLNLFDSDFDGQIDGTLSLQGRGERLDGTLEARLVDARGRGTPAAQGIDGALKGRLSDSQLTLDLETTNEQGLRANANLVLPTESSARPFRVAIVRQRPMRGKFFAEGEVRPIWELAMGGERALSGFVRTDGVIAGTLARPDATGQIAVERGRFDDGASGLSLRDVALRATFDQDAVNVSDARGADGRGGQLNGQGRISLLPDGLSSFRLDLKGFRLIDNETATASATGLATINRAADGKVKLTGNLTIDRADVAADPLVPTGVVAMDVREVNRPDDLPVAFAGARKKGDGWALDVNLKAPRRVFLRGRGLDVEMSLDAHVGGTTANTNLTGTARVVRGDYDFAGKRFAFDETSVVYLSSRPQNIRLQLDATREDPTLKVTVRIRGTAARPEITLASSPSLPNDEVLAKVLFERSASQLSPVEAAQLASALSSLTGGGGLDVIGNLKSFAGLDRLAFGGGSNSSVTVSGGKYLTDDVYLELTGGSREGPSAQVEWRLRKNLSILSRLAGQAGNRLAIRWRKDY